VTGVSSQKLSNALASNQRTTGPQNRNRTSAAAMAHLERELKPTPSPQQLDSEPFPKTYLLCGPTPPQAPGLSNKRFRSWLRFARTI